LYQAALRSQPVHAIEHVCLLGTALLFWRAALIHRGRGHLSYAGAIAYVFSMALQSSVLGVVIACSRPWYAAYAAYTTAWGMTPAEDQQIAGLIMWIPAGAIYLLMVVLLIVRWTVAAERNAERSEHACARGAPLQTTTPVGGQLAGGAEEL
jgi:putative membrane protein